MIAMLYQPDTELLFPIRLIPTLRNLRGPEWANLIDYLAQHDETHPDILALALVMIRVNNCLACHADSYRALRGCTICTHQILIRYRGTDEQLIAMWEEARQEIRVWLTEHPTVLKKHPPTALVAQT